MRWCLCFVGCFSCYVVCGEGFFWFCVLWLFVV